VLDDRGKEAAVRANACKVLARIGDTRSVEVLCAHLADAEGMVRGGVISALTMVLNHSPSVRLDKKAVNAALRAEGRHAFELLALADDLGLDQDALLLEDAIRHRQEQATGRIFGLLALKYPAETIELVSRNLHSGQVATRANAVEVLDNLLDGEEKSFIIPLFDEAPAAKKLSQVADQMPVARTNRRRRLASLLESSDEWLRVCAALAAGAWRERGVATEVRALLESPSALSRETAIVALVPLSDADSLKQGLDKLKADPERSVSRYAKHVLAEIG